MVNKFFQNFNAAAASHKFIGRKAERQIGAFLDTFGEENLKSCIEKNIWLTDCLPEPYKFSLKKMCLPYVNMLPAFSDEEVYLWIPERQRLFVEALPGGRKWAFGQLGVIRAYLMS